ncbi:hypothetical protein GCM10028867_04450 [Nocardioides pacificus]
MATITVSNSVGSCHISWVRMGGSSCRRAFLWLATSPSCQVDERDVAGSSSARWWARYGACPVPTRRRGPEQHALRESHRTVREPDSAPRGRSRVWQWDEG